VVATVVLPPVGWTTIGGVQTPEPDVACDPPVVDVVLLPDVGAE
jgi:hypothetical protein